MTSEKPTDPRRPPDDLFVRLWRYMDFTKFVAMLEHGGLFFSRACFLDDPFEGSSSKANEVLRPQIYDQAIDLTLC